MIAKQRRSPVPKPVDVEDMYIDEVVAEVHALHPDAFQETESYPREETTRILVELGAADGSDSEDRNARAWRNALMNIRAITDPPFERMIVPSTPQLDAVTVFWENYGPGRGSVTLVCWGCAWNCSFFGMDDKTIKQFFQTSGTDYLIKKLGITPHLYQRKRDYAYLGRIIDAVKAHLKEQTS
jgi:hypothetical protein